MKAVLLFFLIFSLFIFIYNLSIYALSIFNGVKAEKFYLWYDSFFSLLKFTYRGTEFGLGWLPLGGYVKLSGMTLDKDEEIFPHYFLALSLKKQFFINFSGPVSSLVVVLLTLIYFGDSEFLSLLKAIGIVGGFTLFYFFIFQFISPLTKNKIHSNGLKISIYLFLVLLKLVVLFVIMNSINSVFPIFEYLDKVFVQNNRIHFFYFEDSAINLKTLICSVGLINFFLNLIPFGSAIGGNMVNICYKSLTGESVNERFVQNSAIVHFIASLIIYAYLVYMFLI